MKIKTKLLTFDKFDLKSKMPTISNAILGSRIIVNSLPCTVETITVVNILEGVTRDNNKFNISISHSNNKKIGDIYELPSEVVTYEGEAILCYRFQGLNFFENSDYYNVEVYHEGKLIDRYKLGVATSFYEIYQNKDVYGLIPALVN